MDGTEKVLKLARECGLLAAADLEAEGLPRRYLPRLEKRGRLERVARGIYALPNREITEHHDLAVAAKRVGKGAVVCLLSALRFHELTTQAPFEVWMALEEGRWEPKSDSVPLRTVHMSEASHSAGVEEQVAWKVPVKVYSPAKTVADCFKFRSAVGLDVALEALRAFRRPSSPGGAGTGSMDELWRFAGICRMRSVMRPYMEAIA
jgi:predicted transcriptional regulator of viral defense system